MAFNDCVFALDVCKNAAGLCFFILGGYLPFNFFQWTNLNGKASNRYISARCYTTKGLCRWFGGMNQELLPLCAVLTGNDYGAPKDAETLLALLDVSYLRGGGARGRGRAPSSRIEGLLLWLSSFSTPGEALDEVSRLMGDGDSGRGKRGGKGGLSSQLWAGMQEYHITPQSSLARWFSGGKAALGGKTSGLLQLPECLSQAAAKGLLAPLVVDALVMHRVLLMPQVENSKLASSHCSARAIRQAIYGILLQRGGQDNLDARAQANTSQGTRGGRGQGGGGRGGGQMGAGRGRGHAGFTGEQVSSAAVVHAQPSVCVEEYDRLDLSLKKNQVEVHQVRIPLCLDTLGQVTPWQQNNPHMVFSSIDHILCLLVTLCSSSIF